MSNLANLLKSRRARIIIGVAAIVTLIPIAVLQYLPSRTATVERATDHVVAKTATAEATKVTEQKQRRRTRQKSQTVVAHGLTFAPSGALLGIADLQVHTDEHDRTTEASTKESTATRTAETQVEQTTTRETITTPLPRWSVGVGVGLDVFKLSPVYQLDAAYRVGGPFSVAGWVQVRHTDLHPTVGLSGRLAF